MIVAGLGSIIGGGAMFIYDTCKSRMAVDMDIALPMKADDIIMSAP